MQVRPKKLTNNITLNFSLTATKLIINPKIKYFEKKEMGIRRIKGWN